MYVYGASCLFSSAPFVSLISIHPSSSLLSLFQIHEFRFCAVTHLVWPGLSVWALAWGSPLQAGGVPMGRDTVEGTDAFPWIHPCRVSSSALRGGALRVLPPFLPGHWWGHSGAEPIQSSTVAESWWWSQWLCIVQKMRLAALTFQLLQSFRFLFGMFPSLGGEGTKVLL